MQIREGPHWLVTVSKLVDCREPYCEAQATIPGTHHRYIKNMGRTSRHKLPLV